MNLTYEVFTCGLAFAVSKSWSVTSWMTSFFLWTSPFGRGTYSSASKSNSVAKESDLPCLCKLYLLKKLYQMLPQKNLCKSIKSTVKPV